MFKKQYFPPLNYFGTFVKKKNKNLSTGGGGGINWEIGIDIYILLYIKDNW